MKLDSLSKILIATGQINYMAASLFSVNTQIRMIPDEDGVHKDGIEDREAALQETVKELGQIMEKLGNCINRWDCICNIDERVATVPFNIIIHGKDDTEEEYEEFI